MKTVENKEYIFVFREVEGNKPIKLILKIVVIHRHLVDIATFVRNVQ